MNIRQNGIIYLTIYLCTLFIFNDFGIPLIIPSFLILIVAVLDIYQSIKQHREVTLINLSYKKYFLLFIVVMILLLSRSDLSNREIQYYLFTMLVSSPILLCSETNEKAINSVVKTISITGTFISVLVISSKILPSFYQNLVYPILTENAAKYNNRLYLEGYSYAVYESISYTVGIIIATLCLSINKENKSKKDYIYAIFYYIAIVLVGRRTELLFGTIIVLLTVYIQNKEKINNFIKCNRRKFAIVLCIFVFILIIGIIVLQNLAKANLIRSRYLITILQINNHIDTSNGRSTLFLVAVDLIKQHPVFGIGWMNFRKFAYRSGDGLATNVHNIYLQLIAENGIFLGSFLIWLIISMLITFWSVSKKSKNGIIGVQLMLYIMLVGLLDNTLYYSFFWPCISIGYYLSNCSDIEKFDILHNDILNTAFTWIKYIKNSLSICKKGSDKR